MMNKKGLTFYAYDTQARKERLRARMQSIRRTGIGYDGR